MDHAQERLLVYYGPSTRKAWRARPCMRRWQPHPRPFIGGPSAGGKNLSHWFQSDSANKRQHKSATLAWQTEHMDFMGSISYGFSKSKWCLRLLILRKLDLHCIYGLDPRPWGSMDRACANSCGGPIPGSLRAASARSCCGRLPLPAWGHNLMH